MSLQATFERPKDSGFVERIVFTGDVPLEVANAMLRGFAAPGHDGIDVAEARSLANVMASLASREPNRNAAWAFLYDALGRKLLIDEVKIRNDEVGVPAEDGGCSIVVTATTMAVTYDKGSSERAYAFAMAAGVHEDAIPPELYEAATGEAPVPNHQREDRPWEEGGGM